jgi:hypothetical protein
MVLTRREAMRTELLRKKVLTEDTVVAIKAATGSADTTSLRPLRLSSLL